MIAVVDYQAGNTRSVLNALHRIGAEGVLTADHAVLAGADRVIFPGVGEAGSAMHVLRAQGMDRLLAELNNPVLGICLGLQLMCAFSEEGSAECLGIFPEHVLRFPDEDVVPHMGWNNLSGLRGPLFQGISESDDFYFVHSYYAEKGADTVATCNYIRPFSAAMSRNNFHAVQFHPEKSGAAGERLLCNFLSL